MHWYLWGLTYITQFLRATKVCCTKTPSVAKWGNRAKRRLICKESSRFCLVKPSPNPFLKIGPQIILEQPDLSILSHNLSSNPIVFTFKYKFYSPQLRTRTGQKDYKYLSSPRKEDLWKAEACKSNQGIKLRKFWSVFQRTQTTPTFPRKTKKC